MSRSPNPRAASRLPRSAHQQPVRNHRPKAGLTPELKAPAPFSVHEPLGLAWRVLLVTGLGATPGTRAAGTSSPNLERTGLTTTREPGPPAAGLSQTLIRVSDASPRTALVGWSSLSSRSCSRVSWRRFLFAAATAFASLKRSPSANRVWLELSHFERALAALRDCASPEVANFTTTLARPAVGFLRHPSRIGTAIAYRNETRGRVEISRAIEYTILLNGLVAHEWFHASFANLHSAASGRSPRTRQRSRRGLPTAALWLETSGRIGGTRRPLEGCHSDFPKARSKLPWTLDQPSPVESHPTGAAQRPIRPALQWGQYLEAAAALGSNARATFLLVRTHRRYRARLRLFFFPLTLSNSPSRAMS